MLIIDKPYVSDFLIDTIKNNHYPVLKTDVSQTYKKTIGASLLSDQEFIEQYRNASSPKVYTNSENAIGWISEHLAFSELPNIIALFKDKYRFRQLTQKMYPELYFKSIDSHHLNSISNDDLKFPFIIKPAIGFFSMGVFKVNSPYEWESTKMRISEEIKQVKHLYPTEVLDVDTFIIEEYIEGDEYAFDAYYDKDGRAVLLNAYKHYFASSEDVSDRVYYTSKQIIEEHHERFSHFLNQIGHLTSARNFPVHVEVRIDAQGQAIPIEVNPLRFGGWCTTADLTHYAFGINPYEYFLNDEKPDWTSIFSQTDDSLYSVIVLDNSTGIDGKKIKSFNYDQLKTQFSKVLELRKVDYTEYPVFGFVYAEVKADRFEELERICQSRLNEFIEVE